ncbi:MAG TPA: DUF3047 domain-containing protein [Desulfuromonadales bacterium]|nr:DUF3047 domain-containing protein [Desulfuromonadales bacterium]
MKLLLNFSLIILFLAVAPVGAADERILIDDFENGLAPGWSVKSFAGETRYQVVKDGANHVLRAESSSAASGLVYEIEFDPGQWPVLSWRWKIRDTIARGDAHSKQGDDYAARVYVIFPHWFFPKTRTLNYIWANHLPEGEILANAYTDNAMMLVVASGPDQAGKWMTVRRNIVSDFRRAFGEDPPQAGAIAIMTDTDDTGAQATAWYDDLRLQKAAADE